MSKKSFIAKASVIAFAVLSIVLFKPADVKAYNNGCDIVSPSTMVNRYHDQPSKEYKSWDGWKSYYAGYGFTYVDCSPCSVPQGSSGVNLNGWWMHLRSGSTDYWVLTYESSDQYAVHTNSWRLVNESTGGVYYYANEYGIVLTNTWAHIRVGNEAYQPTDAHGYFVFDSSGRMCTGWHKDSDDKWYYTRIDHTNNTDGPSMKVGVDSGFLWETVKEPTTYSEGLYYFTGINVKTNVYKKTPPGSYNYADTSTVKYGVGDADKQVKPLTIRTVRADTDFVNGQCTDGYWFDSSVSGTVSGSFNLGIANADYASYFIPEFQYYLNKTFSYKQQVYVRYQKSDGSWGDYSAVINDNYEYGSKVSWSRARDDAYEAASLAEYTVTEAKTSYVNVYRRSYNQTINYYYNKASGTYNSPTHTKTTLGSKSWSQLYGTTFNAEGYKAAWGNVDGYHWSSIDSKSWTVKGAASTNSYYSANKYRLSVDKKNGSDVVTYDMEYGTNINLGTPTRTGWAFKGWDIVTNNSTNSSLSSNQFTMGYNNSYKYQTYVAVPTVKIIANWEDVTAPAGNDTILKATNPTKTTTYASVTASTPKADTPWVNNNVLLTFTSKDNESGLSGLGIYEKITSGWKAVSSKTLSGATTAQSITYTDSKEGSYTYYGKATDNASTTHGSPANKITSTAELTVHIDKTVPVYKEELLTTDIKHGSLPHGMTTGGVVVDTETGDVNINELNSKITVEVSDENSTLADSTDVSGIKKVTLVVYDSDYVTDSDVYTNIYKAGTGKDALTSALKYKEYDMIAESDSIKKNGAGAIYEAVYAVTTNLYEDFKTSASLKYFMVAVDNAGNENKVYSAEGEAISNISIYAYITRNAKDLDDGSDNFLCGDGGTLHIVTYGYLDELDIDFPSKLLKAALLDAERMQGEHPLGTTQKDNAEYVEGAFLDPTITLTGDCQRNYDYPFVVPLYLGDESIEFLTKAPTWTDENPVYDMTEILTFETGYKHTNTMSGTATAIAQTKAGCYVGTHDDGATKMTDRFHTHIIAPD